MVGMLVGQVAFQRVIPPNCEILEGDLARDGGKAIPRSDLRAEAVMERQFPDLHCMQMLCVQRPPSSSARGGLHWLFVMLERHLWRDCLTYFLIPVCRGRLVYLRKRA